MYSIREEIIKTAPKIVCAAVIMQPILDVISYVLEQAGVLNPVVLLRAILFTTLLVSAYLVSRKKRNYIIAAVSIVLFWLLHVGALILTGSYQNPLSDLAMYIRVVQVPLLLMAFITLFKANRRAIDAFLLGASINLGLVFTVLVLSHLTNTVHYAYRFAEIGSVGWFSNVNGQGLIVIVLTLMTLLYFYKRQSMILMGLSALVGFCVLFSIGTRVAFYAIPAIALIALGSFTVSKVRKPGYYIVIVLACSLFIGLYQVSPVRKNAVDIASRETTSAQRIQGKVEQTSPTDKISSTITAPKTITTKGATTLRLQSQKEATYRLIVPDHIKKYGLARTYEAFNNTVDTSILRDYRVQKRVFVMLAIEDSPVTQKLFGNEYRSFVYNGESFEPENDGWSLLFLYGYLGMALYYMLILVILLIVVGNIKRRMCVTTEICFAIGGVALVIVASLVAGHVALRTNVAIYLSLLLALAYVSSVGMNIWRIRRKGVDV